MAWTTQMQMQALSLLLPRCATATAVALEVVTQPRHQVAAAPVAVTAWQLAR